ncbi:MAG: flagellar motor switch protein FliN [Planctomycetes bacterium]|nr:flagellar motor switch protein FliN [Planctomycetota bacterium]
MSDNVTENPSQTTQKNYIDLDALKDIPLDLRVELGKAKLTFEQILQLQKDSVVELDKYTGSPVDIYANNKLIAKGELIVVDDNFAVRITELSK